MKRLLPLILFISLSLAGKAQSWQDTVNIITHLFDRYKPENPGGQLSISRNGKIIFSKAWGLADVERRVPYTTETVTEAGSITKQFTAAAILLLEQQGKLSLDNDVRKYLPELPNYGSVVRLKYLLHHTSGVREWSDLEAITGWPRTTRAYTNEDVFKLLCRQKKLNNISGTEFIYSNSNYVLLTLIIERISGMRLPEFTEKYIFKPAGMTHTSWRDDFKKIVPNRGIAYIKKNGLYEINMPNENVYGPGALLTTTEDLLKWTNYFLNNKLGNPGLLAKQLAIEPITGGAEADYAAGLFIGKFKGYDIISHTGQTAGYVGVLESLPALKLSVAWLSNTTDFKDSLFVGITATESLFIKSVAPDVQAQTTDGVTLSPAINKKYSGWYRNTKTNHGVNISLKHDTLWLNGNNLTPISQTSFRFLESAIAFDAVGGFIYKSAEKVIIPFTKERATEKTAGYLKAFTGTFYSKETESSFEIIFKDGQLMLEQNYLKDVVLRPSFNNAFDLSLNLDSDSSPVSANILFKRNANKGIYACEVSMNDARKIEFVKIK